MDITDKTSFLRAILLFLVSLLIVAFGTPAISMWLSPIASAFGFGVFFFFLKLVKNKKNSFFFSLVWFFFVQGVQLSWFSATRYQGSYILIVYFFLVLTLSAQFAFFSMIIPKRVVKLKEILMLASVWTLIEMSRLFFFCGFAFNPVGLSICYHSYSMQLLSVVGVYGMTFLVVATGFLFQNVLTVPSKKWLLGWLGIVLIPYVFSYLHIQYRTFEKKHAQNHSFNVALIQTGLKPDEKNPIRDYKSFVPLLNQWMLIIKHLKQAKAHRLDYIVLPEACVPYGLKTKIYPKGTVVRILKALFGDEVIRSFPEGDLYVDGKGFVSNAFFAQTLANVYQSELIIGLDDYDEDSNSSYNAGFLFQQGEKPLRYEKQILVPLAEYLPLGFLKPLVARYGISSHATHGKKVKVFEGKKRVSISICYEECFGHLIRKGKLLGANLLVNISNDGWYYPSDLPEHHFALGRLRAVENGVDVLRCCNTGVSAVVSSLGQVLNKLEGPKGDVQNQRGILEASFVPFSYKTIYSLCGDYLVFCICLISCFYCVLENVARRKKLIEIES